MWNKRKRIISISVDAIGIDAAVTNITEWAIRGLAKYVCLANVHMCMEAFGCKSYKTTVNNADMILADSRPIYWALRSLGQYQAEQVRGSDLLLSICSKSAKKNISVGFYGGTSNCLEMLKFKIKNKFSKLKVNFIKSPPFRLLTAQEDDHYVDLINDSGIKILFVGLGCPKQEKWMNQHKGKLNCVMIGVGAAFDFVSGRKKNAPVWMQEKGLEWLFRLITEPIRLWKRYLTHNPRFVWLFIQQLIIERRNNG